MHKGLEGSAVALSVLLIVSSGALAGTPDDPEIEDPADDGIHYEFQNAEPSLDVTKVWFTWEDGTLSVHLLVADVETFGSAGTQDPFDSGTRYDVYWTMDGEDYVARVAFCTAQPTTPCLQDTGGEALFLAGQSMRIHRQLTWEMGTDIHGELAEQTGVAETGSPAHLRIDVDPASVGNPGPGSVIEAPAFSTYVDHHSPASDEERGVNHHHPGHVDLNDSPGADFAIPASGDEDPAGEEDGQADGSEEDDDLLPTPAPGPAELLIAAILLGGWVGRRREG